MRTSAETNTDDTIQHIYEVENQGQVSYNSRCTIKKAPSLLSGRGIE